jgi:hypothetical protein
MVVVVLEDEVGNPAVDGNVGKPSFPVLHVQ